MIGRSAYRSVRLNSRAFPSTNCTSKTIRPFLSENISLQRNCRKDHVCIQAEGEMQGLRCCMFSTSVHGTSDSQPNVTSMEKNQESFLVNRYRDMAKKANIMLDEHQIEALTELDRLRDDIDSSYFYTTANRSRDADSNTSIGDNEENETIFPFYNKLSTFFNSGGSALTSTAKNLTNLRRRRGVYLHGGVGCGKTFCMDLFFESLGPSVSKQKVHFHKFMLNVHKQMHEAKMVDRVEGDVLPTVIDNTIQDGLVICFDEFQVTDVADALILRRLFTGLLDKGAVVIATSNRPPEDLYLNGLQRDLFLPFIDLLIERCEVVSMWESETDYRLVQGAKKAKGVYFIGESGKSNFDQSFYDITQGSIVESTVVTTQGRSIAVPQASKKYRVARFSFDDLCRRARGAADYLVIGEKFSTIFIEDVPLLTLNDVNLVRRFIVFVDTMYECRVKLIVHSETKPDGIFQVDLDNQHCDEVFAFDRTRSRLEEMGSDTYLKSRWIGKPSK